MAEPKFVFNLFLLLSTLANIWVFVNCSSDIPSSISTGFTEKEPTKSGRDSLAPRIVGGWRMLQKNHPFLAIIFYDKKLICGGSVITDRFILTAAHCVPKSENPKRYTVYLGAHDLKKIKDEKGQAKKFSVKRIIKHENYEEKIGNILINDIALMEIDKPAVFNRYIKPICIPLNLDLSQYQQGDVAGWGSTTRVQGPGSQFPMQASVSILSNQECQKTNVDIPLRRVHNIYHMVFCAYKKNSDSCTGDSGGPIFVKTDTQKVLQTGIVSFGVGCGTEGFPGLYTRLSSYIDWMKKYVDKFACSV